MEKEEIKLRIVEAMPQASADKLQKVFEWVTNDIVPTFLLSKEDNDEYWRNKVVEVRRKLSVKCLNIVFHYTGNPTDNAKQLRDFVNNYRSPLEIKRNNRNCGQLCSQQIYDAFQELGLYD